MTLLDLGKALEALGRQLQQSPEPTPGINVADFVDVDAAGVGSAARRAARAGQLRAFRVGRRLLVDRTEFRRWVELHRVGPSPAPDRPEPDDVDKVIEMNQRRRRA